MSQVFTAPLQRLQRFDALRLSAGFWLGAMLLAQWAFFYYIVAFYGSSVATGDIEAWNRLAAFGRQPYVPGDTAGNATFAGHALGAGVIALTGALQLVPQVRARFPRFHRWNGRAFLATALALSVSGFYLVWLRGEMPTRIDELATTVNGLLIVGCAVAAWTAIRRRDIAAHRAWAMRLYLAANAQWFQRIGLFAYVVLARAAGHTPGSADGFLLFWKFGCFLVPLAGLQLYLHASHRKSGAVTRSLVASGLVATTLVMLLGAAVFGILCQKIISGAPLSL